mgnify:CR=1 FL=1
MKKKSLKSLSLKKSNVANITGGTQDTQANQGNNAISSICPNPTIILTVHSAFPWDCRTLSCITDCEWCKILP